MSFANSKIVAGKGNNPKPSIVQDRANKFIAETVLQFFSAKELMAIRPVCRLFHDIADRYIWTRYTSYAGASSVIPPQGGNAGGIYDAIRARIEEIALSGGTVRFAADQITNAQLFRGLLGPVLTLDIRVNVGTHAPPGGVAKLPGGAMQLKGLGHGKMHAKFLTGGNMVVLGSPNFTPTALGANQTVESLIVLHNPVVKAYFNRYFDLMRVTKTAADLQKPDARCFSRMIAAFNSANHPISLALAPFVKIQPWLLTQIAGADRLIIRMFLISQARHGQDIVDGLIQMAQANPNMRIDAYVDRGQYWDTFSEYFDHHEQCNMQDYYVAAACHALMQGAPNIRVFTQTGLNGIMHDKLILAEKDIAPGTGHATISKRMIIGSSGFSTNVMANNNFDLLIRVDSVALYDYMMRHHLKTLASAGFNTKKITKVIPTKVPKPD